MAAILAAATFVLLLTIRARTPEAPLAARPTPSLGPQAASSSTAPHPTPNAAAAHPRRRAEPQEAPVSRIVVQVDAASDAHGEDGVPLPGARVTVSGSPESVRDETTGADGRAEFGELPEGEWTVSVSASGFMESSCRVRSGDSVAILLRPGATIEGVVVDAATRRPIAGAEVVVAGSDLPHSLPLVVEDAATSHVFRRLGTQADGTFTAAGVPPLRTLWVVARTATGLWGRLCVKAPAAGAAPSRVEVAVEPCGTMAGTVRLQDGAPAARAYVYAVAASRRDLVQRLRSGWTPEARGGNPDVLAARTGADGTYRLEGLRLGGTYAAAAAIGLLVWDRETARAHATAPAEGLTCTAEHPEARQDFRPMATATLTIHVVASQPLRRCEVAIDDRRIPSVSPAEDVVVQAVRPGRRTVEVSAPGCAAEVRVVEVQAGAKEELTVELAPGVDLVVRVVDAENRPVHVFTTVTASRPGGAVVSEMTDEPGVARLRGLRAVPHRVEASAEGLAPSWIDATPGGAEATIVLRRGGLLRGTVTDTAGRAVADATLLVRGPLERETSSDDAGAFEIRLPPGRYCVVSEDGRTLAEAEVRDDETTPVALRVE